MVRGKFAFILLGKDTSWTGSEQITGGRHVTILFEVHKLVAIKFTVSWDPRIRNLKEVYTFAGTWTIHIQSFYPEDRRDSFVLNDATTSTNVQGLTLLKMQV